ncbi:hypothetical protein [Haemophilus paracuniculus]
MSTSIRFDKLRFVKKLQKADVNSPEFSEKLAEALDEALEQSQAQLATKSDLKDLEVKLVSEMYKMAGFILAGVGALMALLKFFN